MGLQAAELVGVVAAVVLAAVASLPAAVALEGLVAAEALSDGIASANAAEEHIVDR